MRLYEFINEGSPRYTPEQIEYVSNLYNQGLEYEEIVLQTGLTFSQVANIIHRYLTAERVIVATPEEIESVRKLYIRGLPFKEIASQLGIDYTRVCHIVYKYLKDVEKRLNPPTPKEIQDVENLYNQGLEYKDMALQSGMSEGRVRHILEIYLKNRTKRSRPPFSQEEKIKMGELYATGMTLVEIGKVFDAHFSAIPKAVKTLPNYNELREKRLASIAASREAATAAHMTKDVMRSKKHANAKSQGPTHKGVRATKFKDYF